MHCVHNDCPDVIDCDIIEHLTRNFTSENLNVEILEINLKMGISCCSIIEIAIKLQRMDVVKVLVRKGANSVCVEDDPSTYSGVVQLFDEYYEFGTNKFITWLLHEHIREQDIPEFINKVLKIDVFNDSAINMFNDVGRCPAHAFLTCGHQELSEKFLEKHGYEQLTKPDGSGRTALQIAAAQGDFDSVKTLLHL